MQNDASKIKILGTGLTGMVGSRIVELLENTYTFENMSRSTGVDITNSKQVNQKISSSDASIVLHLAAKADVDGCETDRDLGENGQAWQMNVVGTKNILAACKETNKKIIYISTDFVFDGEKEDYTEESVPHAVNWYGETKLEGEKAVLDAGISYIIARIGFPYRAAYDKKKDFVRAIAGLLQRETEIAVVKDQIITPTFVDDIAYALHALIEQEKTGIYHVVGSESLSPYAAAIQIAQVFGLREDLIQETTREKYFMLKAKRPFNLTINNAKIEKLGITMNSFSKGLALIKKQTL